jgi:hypothetical protein
LDNFYSVVSVGVSGRLCHCEGNRMINPGIYNIVCPQGATFDRTFTLTVDGTAQNLTGYTAAMMVRESADASTAVISLSTAGSGIVLGGAAGTIAVTIGASVTGAVDAGSYSYDLELYSGAVTTRLLQGSFLVTGEITRA